MPTVSFEDLRGEGLDLGHVFLNQKTTLPSLTVVPPLS